MAEMAKFRAPVIAPEIDVRNIAADKLVPRSNFYTPDMSMTPRTGVSPTPIAPAPTAVNFEDPHAVNYGRGITEVVNAPGQQGRSFTNRIAPGASPAEITAATQSFRGEPQGVSTPEGASVSLNPSGRGSFRSVVSDSTTTTGAAAPAGAPRMPRSYGFGSLFGAQVEAGAERGRRWETEQATRQQAVDVARAKVVADLSKPETLKKIKFSAPAPDPNGIPTKDAAGNLVYPTLPAKVTLGDTEFDVSPEDYAFARERANSLAAIQLKKNPNIDPETLMNESLQVSLADVIRMSHPSQE